MAASSPKREKVCRAAHVFSAQNKDARPRANDNAECVRHVTSTSFRIGRDWLWVSVEPASSTSIRRAPLASNSRAVRPSPPQAVEQAAGALHRDPARRYLPLRGGARRRPRPLPGRPPGPRAAGLDGLPSPGLGVRPPRLGAGGVGLPQRHPQPADQCRQAERRGGHRQAVAPDELPQPRAASRASRSTSEASAGAARSMPPATRPAGRRPASRRPAAGRNRPARCASPAPRD